MAYKKVSSNLKRAKRSRRFCLRPLAELSACSAVSEKFRYRLVSLDFLVLWHQGKRTGTRIEVIGSFLYLASFSFLRMLVNLLKSVCVFTGSIGCFVHFLYSSKEHEPKETTPFGQVFFAIAKTARASLNFFQGFRNF